MRGASVAALAASAALVIGSFGPWMTLGIISRSGVDASDDAYIQIGLGVVCAVAAWASRYGERKHIGWLLVGGIVSGAVAAYDISQVSSRELHFLGDRLSPETGWGLVMCAIGAGVLIVSSFVLAKSSQNDERPAQGGPSTSQRL